MNIPRVILIRIGGAVGLLGVLIAALDFNDRVVVRIGEIIGISGLLIVVYTLNKNGTASAGPGGTNSVEPGRRGRHALLYYLVGGAVAGVLIAWGMSYLDKRIDFLTAVTFVVPVMLAFTVTTLFLYMRRGR